MSGLFSSCTPITLNLLLFSAEKRLMIEASFPHSRFFRPHPEGLQGWHERVWASYR